MALWPMASYGPCNPEEYLFKSIPQIKQHVSEPPKYGLYIFVLKLPPLKTATINYRHGRVWWSSEKPGIAPRPSLVGGLNAARWFRNPLTGIKKTGFPSPNGTGSRKRTCHRGHAKPHGTATSPFEGLSC